jgi:hypothetical protein
VYNIVILTQKFKFLHPFIAIIYQNVFGHPKLAYDFVFKDPGYNDWVILFYNTCFTLIGTMVYNNKNIFVIIVCMSGQLAFIISLNKLFNRVCPIMLENHFLNSTNIIVSPKCPISLCIFFIIKNLSLGLRTIRF